MKNMKVNWDDEIPNISGKIIQMFQTTNQKPTCTQCPVALRRQRLALWCLTKFSSFPETERTRSLWSRHDLNIGPHIVFSFFLFFSLVCFIAFFVPQNTCTLHALYFLMVKGCGGHFSEITLRIPWRTAFAFCG